MNYDKDCHPALNAGSPVNLQEIAGQARNDILFVHNDRLSIFTSQSLSLPNPNCL